MADLGRWWRIRFDALRTLWRPGWFWLAGLWLEFGSVRYVFWAGMPGGYDEPESLILAQSERWRHA